MFDTDDGDKQRNRERFERRKRSNKPARKTETKAIRKDDIETVKVNGKNRRVLDDDKSLCIHDISLKEDCYECILEAEDDLD